MNILIRKAVKEDMDKIFLMYKDQTILHYDLDPDYYAALAPDEKEQFEKYFTKALSSHEPYFFVAEVDGVIVGFSTFKKSQAANDDSHIKEYCYLLELFVKEEYRKHGIGQKLLEGVEKYCKEEGIYYVRLEVSPRNENAVQFYNDYGFVNHVDVMYKKIT